MMKYQKYGPKITVIGAGSYFFGRPVIYKMATSPHMAGGTLALVDTNPGVLNTMMSLAQRVFKKSAGGVKLIGSTDRRKVMEGSDFVVLTFSERNTYFRGLDTKIAAKHGIKMCSSDTIGPGGIFRALREIPSALDIARDVRRLAPDAWLINYVNPTAVMGMALRKYAPDVRSFALCDGHREPYNTAWWCHLVGILPSDCYRLMEKKPIPIPPRIAGKLDLKIGGVNHCTWLVRFRYGGKDMMPVVREQLVKWVEKEKKEPGEHSKARYNSTCALQLFDLYGAYPTAVGHTKEYVPFFQGYGILPNVPEPIRCFDAEQRAREMAAAWKVTEQYAAGKLSVEDFFKKNTSEHATDIVESMWAGLNRTFYVNSPNRGAVGNLPADAFLELLCHIDMQGPVPLPFGDMPPGLRALQYQILDTHELTADAAVTGDKKFLRRAMLTDPLCNNIPDADACIADLLEAERDVLPGFFRKI
ncbi:MAG: glycoside hydrolase family 4 [Candidatus Omnitrophota bacterium]